MSALEQLLAMGFPEDAAKSCLQAHGGNVEEAINTLLSTPWPEQEQASSKVVLAPGSQYDVDNGRSACSCICLEAAISILGQLRGKREWTGSPDDVQNILSVGAITYEGLVGAGVLTTEHTSVDEVVTTVWRYRDALGLASSRGCHQSLLSSETSFSRIMEDIRNERQRKSCPIAVTITKPPETVVAFLPPENGSDTSSAGTEAPSAPQQWLLFDSHPRPQLGLTGASVQSFEAESALVTALNLIFPVVDVESNSLLASMYNMLDCTPLFLKQRAT